MAATPSSNWLSSYPRLAVITDPVWRKIIGDLQPVRLPPGTIVFRDGDACKYYLLVIDGSVRVQKATADGHEIVLYHIGPGQTCELTTTCLLCDSTLNAHAITESTVTLVRIPKNEFRKAVDQAPAFRDFVYRSLDQGLTTLISVIENVAFVPTHQRLAAFLLAKMSEQHPITLTHQELATELGTAREVISRLLKEFERHGCVNLHRGWIEIADEPSLRDIAS